MRTLFLTLMMMNPLAAFAVQAADEPAPADKGLRLSLSITEPAGREQPAWRISLSIKNTSNAPVTLSHTGIGYADYRAFLKDSVVFTFTPEVANLSEHGAKNPVVATVSETIKAGETFVLEWQQSDIRIGDPWHYHANGLRKVRVPTDGKYQVTAHAKVSTETGEAHLDSNTVTLLVGGKETAPRALSAKVIAGDAEKKTAVIDLGNESGVQKGDVFWRMDSEDDPAIWTLTVTAVEEKQSRCSVKSYPVHLRTTPKYPAAGETVLRGVEP